MNTTSLLSVRDVLEQSLQAWMQAKKGFEDGNAWSKGRYAAQNIVGRITKAADVIEESVRVVRADDLNPASIPIYRASVEMADAVHDGTDNLLDHRLLPDATPDVFVSWQAVCAAVESFARSAVKEVTDAKSKHPGIYDGELSHAVGCLVGTAIAAKIYRKKGIRGHLQGPLSEYALEDARLMGLSINKQGRFWSIESCSDKT
jgi:hypothetical protein